MDKVIKHVSGSVPADTCIYVIGGIGADIWPKFYPVDQKSFTLHVGKLSFSDGVSLFYIATVYMIVVLFFLLKLQL